MDSSYLLLLKLLNDAAIFDAIASMIERLTNGQKLLE
jgi:hypothetical protein